MEMFEPTDPIAMEDSLERIERFMAIERALIHQIQEDRLLTPGERQRLIREVEERIRRAESGDEGDSDDEGLAALVRKLGPRSPRGQAGAAVRPEVPSFESTLDIQTRPDF